MNLRIADGAGLVTFLHRVVSSSGTPVLSTGGLTVVQVEGPLFYHGDQPLTVGGPFSSLEALVRSEGLRRYAESREGDREGPSVEVFEWAASFFRISDDDARDVRQYRTLEEAKNGSP